MTEQCDPVAGGDDKVLPASLDAHTMAKVLSSRHAGRMKRGLSAANCLSEARGIGGGAVLKIPSNWNPVPWIEAGRILSPRRAAMSVTV